MISKKELEYLAELSRLKFSDEEILLFSDQIQKILSYIKQIDSISTEDVLPLFNPNNEEIRLREDKVESNKASTEDCLKNSNDIQGQLFKIPPVF